MDDLRFSDRVIEPITLDEKRMLALVAEHTPEPSRGGEAGATADASAAQPGSHEGNKKKGRKKKKEGGALGQASTGANLQPTNLNIAPQDSLFQQIERMLNSWTQGQANDNWGQTGPAPEQGQTQSYFGSSNRGGYGGGNAYGAGGQQRYNPLPAGRGRGKRGWQECSTATERSGGRGTGPEPEDTSSCHRCGSLGYWTRECQRGVGLFCDECAYQLPAGEDCYTCVTYEYWSEWSGTTPMSGNCRLGLDQESVRTPVMSPVTHINANQMKTMASAERRYAIAKIRQLITPKRRCQMNKLGAHKRPSCRQNRWRARKSVNVHRQKWTQSRNLRFYKQLEVVLRRLRVALHHPRL